MCTRFLYIDGENLSKEIIIDSVTNFISSLAKSDKMVGKFYGAKELVKTTVPFCMLQGLSYVETSCISFSHKNVADMKITVDCISDVTKCTDDEIMVTILSKDCDFLPLVFKLKELGVNVETPFINLDAYHGENDTTRELDHLLKHKNFYSNKNSKFLDNMYDNIMEVTNGSFNSDVVEEHIRIRTHKFILQIEELCGKECADKLRSLPAKDFSLAQVIHTLGITGKKALNKVYLLYVCRICGFTPKQKVIPDSILREVALLAPLREAV